jgi:hypothetical protein
MVPPSLSAAHLSDPIWRRLVALLGRRSFGNGSASDLVDWGVEALVAGWESQSLNVLAGLAKPPNDFEVDRYVERMMAELGIETPDTDRLASLYGVAVAASMLAGDTAPYEGAKELYRLWLNTGCRKVLQPWAMFEDQYELARDQVYGDVADVERDILAEARRMVGQHSRGQQGPGG